MQTISEYEDRCKAYKDFFGESWEEILNLSCSKGRTPEEVAEILWKELDFCDYCGNYYLSNPDRNGVYYCPYCHVIGKYSERDYDAEREARGEHEYETRNNK